MIAERKLLGSYNSLFIKTVAIANMVCDVVILKHCDKGQPPDLVSGDDVPIL